MINVFVSLMVGMSSLLVKEECNYGPLRGEVLDTTDRTPDEQVHTQATQKDRDQNAHQPITLRNGVGRCAVARI